MRRDYQKLVDDLPALAISVGAALDAGALDDAAILMRAVDALDDVLDRGDDETRARLRAHALAVLRGEHDDDGALGMLRTAIARRGVVDRFVTLTAAILANTERMRGARTTADYIAHCELEGMLLVDLTALVLGEAGAGIVAFLYAVARPANLWDKLVDARADFANGELAIRPGIRFHVRLATRLVATLPPAVRAHPRPRYLATWLAGWARAGAQRS